MSSDATRFAQDDGAELNLEVSQVRKSGPGAPLSKPSKARMGHPCLLDLQAGTVAARRRATADPSTTRVAYCATRFAQDDSGAMKFVLPHPSKARMGHPARGKTSRRG